MSSRPQTHAIQIHVDFRLRSSILSSAHVPRGIADTGGHSSSKRSPLRRAPLLFQINNHERASKSLVDVKLQVHSSSLVFRPLARPRSLQLVKWLSRQRGSICTVAAMDGAAGGGHLEVLRWLARNRREGCSQAAFEMAAGEGHLNVIKVHRHGNATAVASCSVG